MALERLSSTFALSEPETLALIADVVATVRGPVGRPDLPYDALAPRDYFAARSDGGPEASSPAAVKTARWLRLVDESMQADRGALSALLWACDALRVFRGRPEFERLGAPLALALRAFDASGQIPEDPIERRAVVEAYGTRGWAQYQGRRAV